MADDNAADLTAVVGSPRFEAPCDQGLAEWLTGLARELHRGREPSSLRRAFESGLRDLVGARAVCIREESPQAVQAAAHRQLTAQVSCDVPTGDPCRRVALEVWAHGRRAIGGMARDTLASAACLAAVVVEVERMRTVERLHHAPFPARSWSDGPAHLVGSSPAMLALRARMERIALTDFTVLLEGESGTGKELVARQLHESSRRRNGPFVAVNCAALVETLLEAELFGIEDRTATGVRGRRGKFEQADGGTLFLDEVSDLSLSAQAKLLRAIQDPTVERVGGFGGRRVDVRIIAATNRGLADLVAKGLFREDLFYRLSGVDLKVPPLRARQHDIAELADYFLERHKAVRPVALSPVAMDALMKYEWPGNVRELERMMEASVALAEGPEIRLEDLPSAVRVDHAAVLVPSLDGNDTMRRWRSRYARLVLDRCRGNKRAACRVLGISYHTLQAYLRHGRRRPGGSAAPIHARKGKEEGGLS
jgi:transcriptional regulator with PAS, ATPase and Fis domain